MADIAREGEQSVFRSMWVKILLAVVGVVVIVFGAYQILRESKSAKNQGIPLDAFNEINSMFGVVSGDLKSAGDILIGITAKEQVKNYTGILKDLSMSTAKFDEGASKINELNSKIAEFKTTINASADAAVKDSGTKLIGLWQERNDATVNLINDEKKIIGSAQKYYEGLSVGKKVTFMTEAELNAATKRISGDKDALAALSGKLDAAIQDFAKAAGFQLKSAQK